MRLLSMLPEVVWIVAAVAGLMTLGFLKMRGALVGKVKSLRFGKEYRDRFVRYANSQGADRETYQWLTRKAEQMQRDMGGTGIYASFREPFDRAVYENYPVILNMLPRIRQMMDDNDRRLWQRQVGEYVHAVDEALLRYLGSLEDECAEARRGLANPIGWFREGISQVLSMPLYVLSVFGLMGARTIESIQHAALFKFVAGLCSLIGIVSAVIGLITGWSPAVAILKGLLGG